MIVVPYTVTMNHSDIPPEQFKYEELDSSRQTLCYLPNYLLTNKCLEDFRD